MKLAPLMLLALLCNSCIKEIGFSTESFESALVIDATITNELKNQEIILSRTYKFEENGPLPEEGAVVKIIGNGIAYLFEEVAPGKYLSQNMFRAVSNIDYELNIVTFNGRSYASNKLQLTQETQIDDLYAERETNDDGVNGMSIYIDSFDPTASSKFYRYEYEETYKIVAPNWVPLDLVVVNDVYPDCEVTFADRGIDQQICYNTVLSQNINQMITENLTEDRVSRHSIRFLRSDDYIISHRYSILVRQFVQSAEAYSFTSTLGEFSGSGSLFSQTQPGFFAGNIFSEANAEEKVIGFFEVSSVDSKRIYFNYSDYYPSEDLPPYVTACVEFAPKLFNSNGSCGSLITGLLYDGYKYVGENDYNNNGGPHSVVIRPCGDCTALGSGLAPDFWVD